MSDRDLAIGAATPALVMDRLLLVDDAGLMRRLFATAVEGVEEAVLNALRRAEVIVGREGHTLCTLSLEEAAGLDAASGWSEQRKV